MNDNVKQSQWSVWRAMLNGERPEIRVDTIYSGFYRKKLKKGSNEYMAVAIWKLADGTFTCQTVSKSYGVQRTDNEDEILLNFSFGSKNPITKEAYDKFADTLEWADGVDKEIKVKETREEADEPTSIQATLEDKEGLFTGLDTEGIPIKALKYIHEQAMLARQKFAKIEVKLKEQANDYASMETLWLTNALQQARERMEADEAMKHECKTEEDATRLSSLKSANTRFGNDLEDHRKTLKSASWDLGKLIDDTWRVLTDANKKLVAKLKNHQLPYLQEQERLKKEAQKKAAEEAEKKRKEADRLKKEQEELDKKAVQQNDPDAVARVQNEAGEKQAELEKLQKDANKLEKKATDDSKVNVGVTGNKTTLVKVVNATIDNYETALNAVKYDPDFKKLAEDFIIRKAKKDKVLSGVKVWEEDKVR